MVKPSKKLKVRDVFNLCGFCLMVGGCSIVMAVGVMIPLFTVWFEFNIRMVEEYVIDSYDGLSSNNRASFYNKFRWGSTKPVTSNLFIDAERIESSRFYQYFLYHVENPDLIMTGATPFVAEKGPYGYREYTVKYDLVFDRWSDLVAFKSWSYYVPVSDLDSCKYQNRQLGVDKTYAYSCIPDDDENAKFTLLNRQFMQYLQEHTVGSVIGQVSKYMFSEIRDIFTSRSGPFQRNLKVWELPSVLDELFILQSRQKIPLGIRDVVEYKQEYFSFHRPQITMGGAQPREIYYYQEAMPRKELEETGAYPGAVIDHQGSYPDSFKGEPVDVSSQSATAWVKQMYNTNGMVVGIMMGPDSSECCWCVACPFCCGSFCTPLI
jgi:hypothetical protein